MRLITELQIVDELQKLLGSVSAVTWVNNTNVISKVSVGALRGKIIFIYGGEFSDFVSNNGFQYQDPSDHLEIQDDYNGPEVKKKPEKIINTITCRNRNKLTLNHVSAAMEKSVTGGIEAYVTGDTTPLGYANRLNPNVERFLANYKEQQSLGIVIYDFIDFDLSWAVIKHNFGI